MEYRKELPGGNIVIEFRRNWAPLFIVATCSVALLIPALIPSVQAKDSLPPLGAPAFTDAFNGLDAGYASSAMGPSDAAMAALHEQASAALRELQMASATPQ